MDYITLKLEIISKTTKAVYVNGIDTYRVIKESGEYSIYPLASEGWGLLFKTPEEVMGNLIDMVQPMGGKPVLVIPE